ncbi:DUF4231 domain-containing protein [Clostridium perfringens]|uniref:DUF4231 domain-containing protein n=1 Tax=Clostridium perfringens TaxID=1502 RepID=UPI00124010F4|nr:DUF4231 domain-containing protein [Clostridium perfringens]MBS5923176.1 DUF4231 domain-containing protein [Clostridium perfringens]MCX0395412.1 DUF4231 domain-containing protein [Clostridium perfringens]MDU7725586.1 DUF4231 domain-containing protein [Clostridium perfringens]BDA29148.1 hypothetical protein CPBEC3_22830 [Clostridium perfringens]HAT4252579.1 DUF4231 domain-containing protein [Clostridium perfringens]
MKLKDELEAIEIYTSEIKNTIIQKRVGQVLEWNIKKATKYKFLFYLLSIIIIILNASIPIINQINGYEILITIISSIVLALTSIISLINFKDTWHRYRYTAEAIKGECMRFNCRTIEYRDENRDTVFLERIERLISAERELWIESRFNKKSVDAKEEKGKK